MTAPQKRARISVALPNFAKRSKHQRRLSFLPRLGQINGEFNLPIVQLIRINEHLTYPPRLAVRRRFYIGMAAIAGLIVQADTFMLHIVVLQRGQFDFAEGELL